MTQELRAVPQALEQLVRESHKDMLPKGIDDEGTLYIDTYGDCGTCPYNCLSAESELTQTIMKQFPEIRHVSVSPAISDETIAFAKKLLGMGQ